MYKYKIDFSKYKLRDYEINLAVKEFENQFPAIKTKTVGVTGIEFATQNLLDEEKLKKLSFFCQFYYQNRKSSSANIPTNQTIVEGYLDNKPDLFHSFVPKKTREIRYLTHSFHEYKGRFYPQLAKSFMNYAGIQKGDTVLDPFCGSGTTLVESYLFGANAVGVDINPIAFLLAKAKIGSLSLKQKDFKVIKNAFNDLEKTSKWKSKSIDDYKEKLDIDYLKNWFPESNLKRIITIQEIILLFNNKNRELFAEVILSNLLRTFSYQDPSQLRIKRRNDTPPENLFDEFEKNINKQIDNLEKFQSLQYFKSSANVQNYLGDIRTLMKSANLLPSSIDVVITSPPYASALPYVDTDRLSLYAFGFTNRYNFRKLEESVIGNREITKSKREQLDKELENNFKSSILPMEITRLLERIYLLNKNSDVGFRRKNTAALLYKYFVDMNLGISQVSMVLKKNKFAFFVVGTNQTEAGNESIDIPTDDFIGYIAEKNNFKLVEKINMTVQKSYLIHSKNSINRESILVLQRR